jgi:hypothetical protein
LIKVVNWHNTGAAHPSIMFLTVDTLGYIDNIPDPKKTFDEVLISHVHYGNTVKKILCHLSCTIT